MLALQEFAIFLQSVLTALAASCNAAYFLAYRTRRRGRRLGARALALVSLAASLEAAYVAAYVLFSPGGLLWGAPIGPGYWLFIRGIGSLAVFTISGLILRAWLEKKAS